MVNRLLAAPVIGVHVRFAQPRGEAGAQQEEVHAEAGVALECGFVHQKV